MVSEDPPLTKEEISELEKNLSEKLEKSRKKLTNEELEEAKKDFIKRKKREQEEKEKQEENELDNLEKKSESALFQDKNKFIESLNIPTKQNLEATDITERNNFARNLEQQVNRNIFPTTRQRTQEQREEDTLKYSASNYNDSEEKKYTIENDVESHMIGSPQQPQKVDINNVGRENPARQGFNKQVDFQSPYPENFNSDSDKDYIQQTRIEPEKAGRDKESFFEEEFGKKEKKYEVR